MADTLGDFCGVACGVVCAVLVASSIPVTQITLGAVYLHECPASPAVPLYELVAGVATLVVMSQSVLGKLCPSGLLAKIWLAWVLCLSLFALSWFIYGSYHIYVIYQPSFTKPTIHPKGLNDSAYSSADPDVESSSRSPSLFDQTLDTDRNLTSANQTGSVPPGNWSSEVKVEALKALQVTDEAPYCNRTLYLFAFWTTTLVYGLAALSLSISACCYCCFTLMSLLASSTS